LSNDFVQRAPGSTTTQLIVRVPADQRARDGTTSMTDMPGASLEPSSCALSADRQCRLPCRSSAGRPGYRTPRAGNRAKIWASCASVHGSAVTVAA